MSRDLPDSPPEARERSQDPQRQVNFWRLVIAAAACVVYALTLGHGFAFDDGAVIVQNRHVHGLGQIVDIFTSTEWRGSGLENHLYRPLTALSYAGNYALTGTAPWSYHLVNVLLHALTACLVFDLGRCWRLPLQAAGLGALLFAIHPVHVEAVANVVGRKDVLAALFGVSTLLLHRVAARRGGLWFVPPVLTFAAACFAKEMGLVTFGLVLAQDLLLDWGRYDRVARRRAVLLHVSYSAVVVGYLFARWYAVGGFGTPGIPFYDNPTVSAGVVTRILTAVHVIGLGMHLHAWPYPLSPDYSFAAIELVESPWDLYVWMALTLVLIWLVAGIRSRVRTPFVLLSLAVYALALLPSSNLLFPVGTIFGERLLYFPSVGSCLLLGGVMMWILRRAPRKVRFVLPAVILASGAGLAMRYATHWSDDLRLFQYAARNQPDSYLTHAKLGETLVKVGEPGAALPHLKRALQIAPQAYGPRVLLGDAYAALEDLASAEARFVDALELRPRQVGVLYKLGQIRRRRGDLTGAGEAWAKALAVDPWHAPSNGDYGNILYARGDRSGARRCWERAVKTDPTRASAWFSLGRLLDELGEAAAARRAYERFVEVGAALYPEEVNRIRLMLKGR